MYASRVMSVLSAVTIANTLQTVEHSTAEIRAAFHVLDSAADKCYGRGFRDFGQLYRAKAQKIWDHMGNR